MRFMLKPLALLLSASLVISLSGCTSIPLRAPKLFTESEATSKAQTLDESSWNTPPLVKSGENLVMLLTPKSLPASIKNTKVNFVFPAGGTIKDLLMVLSELGVPTVLGDQELGAKPFFLPKYSGKLGHFLDVISETTDVHFIWQNGIIRVQPTANFSISIPQDTKLAEKITAEMASFGGTVALSSDAGYLTVALKPSEYRKARVYLERVVRNAAVVTMQISVVNVVLDKGRNQGVDWAKLQASVGPDAQRLFRPATATDDFEVPESLLSLGSGAASLLISSKNFSLSGIFNLLDTYGKTETLQNTMVRSMTGNAVEIKSITNIPYVSNIGVGVTGSTSSSTTLGTAQTSTATDGLTLKVTPKFDAYANTVSLDLSLAINAVISFTELSAGSQLGTLTQPTTAERSLNSNLKLRPGDVAVIGGLMYDSISDNRSGLVGLSDKGLASSNLVTKRNESFIVVRPTVTVLGALVEKEIGDDWLPSGDTDIVLDSYSEKPEISKLDKLDKPETDSPSVSKPKLISKPAKVTRKPLKPKLGPLPKLKAAKPVVAVSGSKPCSPCEPVTPTTSGPSIPSEAGVPPSNIPITSGTGDTSAPIPDNRTTDSSTISIDTVITQTPASAQNNTPASTTVETTLEISSKQSNPVPSLPTDAPSDPAPKSVTVEIPSGSDQTLNSEPAPAEVEPSLKQNQTDIVAPKLKKTTKIGQKPKKLLKPSLLQKAPPAVIMPYGQGATVSEPAASLDSAMPVLVEGPAGPTLKLDGELAGNATSDKSVTE